MKRFVQVTALVGALVSLAMTSMASAEEEKIPVKELPKAVRKAVKAKFPRAHIKGAAKEEENDRTTYEVMLEIRGRAVDVALKADGTIVEIEKEVPVDELPRAVRHALASKYPKAKIVKAEEIVKGEHGTPHYELAITTEVVLSARGKFVEAEEEEHHEKKAVAKKSKKDEDDEDEDDEDDDRKASVKAKKAERKEHHEKASVKAKKSEKDEKEDEDDDDEKGEKDDDD
jgi:hypothetical protein